MTMSSPTVDRGDGALDGFDEDSELHMGVISMSGDAQEIMGREARGEPPGESLPDRFLFWLF